MVQFDDASVEFRVDLTNCDREPIQFLGHIQAFGCLIAVSSDWIVTFASDNCRGLLGLDPEEMIGTPFREFFGPEAMHELRTRMQLLAHGGAAARLFGYDLRGDGQLFDISIHASGRNIVIEFEPKSGSARHDEMALVQPLIGRICEKDSVEGAAQEAAKGLRALTGLDRVMVYRFEPDGSGSVIAESRTGSIESYLGLRYPASDIPAQARELYKRSLLRLIGDVDGEPVPVRPIAGPDGKPLDLSLAVTRAVSPIHLEYLRNMGVRASLSVSIICRGELWGLLACHHREPYYIDYEKRSAVELFAQLFNYQLAQLEAETELQEVERARALHDLLMAEVSSGVDLASAFDVVSDRLAQVIAFDGLAIFVDGEYRATGSAPSEEEFLGLARFLNTAETGSIYATDEIAARYPKGVAFVDRAAGLLALPVSRTPRDYIVLFRKEIARSVTWAGNPQKAVASGPNGDRLTPRKSFEAWQEVVKGKSDVWRPAEIRAAEALRVTLLEVVLKLSDEANQSRKRAHEQQELLIAELNHRVRNILNLIRSLVSQSRGEAITVEQYGDVLDARIYALSRAHDQLTEKRWDWVPLENMLNNETRAFLNARADRVRLTGDTVELSPGSLTTMALVFHELVTNSAKYGALSDKDGVVDVAKSLLPDGSLRISWVERGGPKVSPPTRKGFGTTIIEHSIPFELKGSARVEYAPDGLEAEFTIPAQHVRRASAQEAPQIVLVDNGSVDVRIEGTALVVDDNMIISMDAEEMLMDLGAEAVHLAGSVEDSLRLIEEHEFSFALLDVNLGGEDSVPVAQRLAEKGVRFILATGYGGSTEVTSRYPGVEVLKKPYTLEQLRTVVSVALKAPG